MRFNHILFILYTQSGFWQVTFQFALIFVLFEWLYSQRLNLTTPVGVATTMCFDTDLKAGRTREEFYTLIFSECVFKGRETYNNVALFNQLSIVAVGVLCRSSNTKHRGTILARWLNYSR